MKITATDVDRVMSGIVNSDYCSPPTNDESNVAPWDCDAADVSVVCPEVDCVERVCTELDCRLSWLRRSRPGELAVRSVWCRSRVLVVGD